MNISVNVVAPMLRLEAVTPEQGYMASVEAFLPSFEFLAISGDQHARASALVSGLIVECILKAYLARKNSKPGEPGDAPKVHDLESLWSYAVQAGLSIAPAAPAWCVVLNSLHYGNKDPQNAGDNNPVPYGLRYPLRYQSRMNGLTFPNTGEMLAGVLALFNAVAHALSSGDAL